MALAGLDHILVLSDDIDASADFYCRALGLTIGERPPFQFPGHWLYAGVVACVHIADRAVYEVHVQKIRMTKPRDAARGRVHHVAFAATDYEAALERLERAGIAPVRNVVPGGAMRQLLFEDPDGLPIEVNFLDSAPPERASPTEPAERASPTEPAERASR